MSDYCPKCGHKHSIKSGKVSGQQRWKCKSCHYQYTRLNQRGRPLWQKSLALLLYCHGMPLHRLATLLKVQPSTVLKWVRSHAGERYVKPEATSAVLVMELEEMWQHLNEQREHPTPGKLWITIENDAIAGQVGVIIK